VDAETKKMLEDIYTVVKKLDSRISKLETNAVTPGQRGSDQARDKTLSLKEFIIGRAPTNAVQSTLTIAYYLENYDQVSPFNAADLEQAFRAAREPVPKNINDKANMCVRNGYFMEDKKKKDNLKSWVVTRTGLQIVEKGFGRQV
jgi:hypothetical protein